MYKVIKFFTDLQDHGHAYSVGDVFPRKGLTVSEKRLIELSTDQNKRGIPLIEAVAEKEPKVAKTQAPEKNAQEPKKEDKKEEPAEVVADEVKKPNRGCKAKKKD